MHTAQQPVTSHVGLHIHEWVEQCIVAQPTMDSHSLAIKSRAHLECSSNRNMHKTTSIYQQVGNIQHDKNDIMLPLM